MSCSAIDVHLLQFAVLGIVLPADQGHVHSLFLRRDVIPLLLESLTAKAPNGIRDVRVAILRPVLGTGTTALADLPLISFVRESLVLIVRVPAKEL
jgi:hypothetical protein